MNFSAFVSICALLVSTSGFAQTQPAASEISNKSGGFAGLNLGIGQAREIPDGESGVSQSLSVDAGYIFAIGESSHFELGIEYGRTALKLGEVREADLDSVILAKFGFGHAIGETVRGVVRLGFGTVDGKYKWSTQAASRTESAKGNLSMIGYDFIFPINNSLDFSAGANFRVYSFEGSHQVNNPSIATGLRIHF